jgi:NADPH:quinone reductase
VRLGGFLLGKRVLITGASGGVGHFAVQIAALAGAAVTAVARSEHAATLIQEGARHVVGEIGEAEGLFDHILESVGGASLEAALTRVAPQGMIVSFGNTSTEDARFNFARLRGHECARIQSFFSYASGSEEDVGRDLALLAGLVGEQRLTVALPRVADWTETGRILQEFRERRFAGKAVLRIVD